MVAVAAAGPPAAVAVVAAMADLGPFCCGGSVLVVEVGQPQKAEQSRS